MGRCVGMLGCSRFVDRLAPFSYVRLVGTRQIVRLVGTRQIARQVKFVFYKLRLFKTVYKYQTNQDGNEKSVMISYLSPGNKLVPVFLRIFYHKEDEEYIKIHNALLQVLHQKLPMLVKKFTIEYVLATQAAKTTKY